MRNPRFGSSRYSGIWPPSNPRCALRPALAFWPLWPRVDVFPMPDPTPRPFLFRGLLLPGLDISWFSINLGTTAGADENRRHMPARGGAAAAAVEAVDEMKKRCAISRRRYAGESLQFFRLTV